MDKLDVKKQHAACHASESTLPKNRYMNLSDHQKTEPGWTRTHTPFLLLPLSLPPCFSSSTIASPITRQKLRIKSLRLMHR
mmetsp:Transcript_52002/g.101836  ORF Transcript_52002/g.101836 Transcript_52002/m.101836 type:complete len:81 (-) Transcript_52002:668-910(-)